ncbi:MAG: flagellar assembly protein FliW [Oscillospiraceae bacterium]|jgi:flagellar assembly factor FliW|nr:flagellar assembly protein FliW [Oscillospiraceae bacterium]
MELKTRDFGNIEIDTADIITFEAPIFAFDEYDRFVLLFEENLGTDITWMQSVQEPDLCFILASRLLTEKEKTAQEVPLDVQEKLGTGEYDKWYMMVVPDGNIKKSTVNLRAPIFINVTERTAGQFLSEEDLPVKHPLFKEGE